MRLRNFGKPFSQLISRQEIGAAVGIRGRNECSVVSESHDRFHQLLYAKRLEEACLEAGIEYAPVNRHA
jgi:hypothetical protein